MIASRDADLVTVAEAAKILRVSLVTVRRWLRQGLLPSFHVGPKAVRIRRADLQAVVTPIRQADSTRSAPEPPCAALEPLSDDEVAQQQAALAASAKLLAEMAARRGGTPFAESWPLIRAARAERSRRQA